MRPFKYTEVTDPSNATRLVAANAEAKFLAGGDVAGYEAKFGKL